jgi:hypothetical protein
MATAGAGEGTLNESMQELVYTLYTENAYAMACIEKIVSSLTRHGIRGTRGTEEATNEFQRVIDEHYLSFCKDVIREILVFGIVAWGLEKIPSGRRVPVVSPGHITRFSYDFKKGGIKPRFSATHTMTGTRIKNVWVWMAPDLRTKSVRSPLSRCVPMHVFETQLMAHAEMVDRRIAATPLVLENTAASGGFWALRPGGYEPYATQPNTFHNLDQREAENSHFQSNFSDPVRRVDERLIELQDSYVKKLNTIGNMDAIAISRMQGGAEEVPRMQLPPHTRVSNVSYAHTRSDLSALLSINTDRICSALNVPRGAFEMQTGSRGEGAVRLVQQQFDESTNSYRYFLNSLLTAALEACTASDDLLFGVVTGDERFAVKPELTLRRAPAQTSDLIDLYKNGFIDRECILTKIENDLGICAARSTPARDGTGRPPATGRGGGGGDSPSESGTEEEQ